MKIHGQITLSSDITSLHPGPLDNKTTVNKLADLIDPNSWRVYDDTTEQMADTYYVGMLVTVADDGIHNGLYQLTRDDPTDLTAWTKFITIETLPSAVRGDWKPIVALGDIVNYPEANSIYRVESNDASALGLDDGDIVFINDNGDGVQRIVKDVGSSIAIPDSDSITQGVNHLFITPEERDLLYNLSAGTVTPDDIKYSNPAPTDVGIGFIPAGYIFQDVTFQQLVQMLFFNDPNAVYEIEAKNFVLSMYDTDSPVVVDAAAGLINGSAIPLNHFVEISHVNGTPFAFSGTYPGNIVGGGNGGTFVIDGDGTLTFDPGTTFASMKKDDTVDVTLTYTIVDRNDGNKTSAGTVTVTVTGTNKAPTSATIPAQAFESTDNYSLDITQYFNDINNDVLTYSIASGSLPDYLTFAAGTGLITSAGSTPTDAHIGSPWTAVIRATDTEGAYASANLSLGVTRPGISTSNKTSSLASTATLVVDSGTAGDKGLLQGVTGKDTSGLAVDTINGVPFVGPSMTVPGVAGILTVTSDGFYTYDPDGTYDHLKIGDPNATLTIPYTVINGEGAVSGTSNIILTISGMLEYPVITEPNMPVPTLQVVGDHTLVGGSIDIELSVTFDKGAIELTSSTLTRTGDVTGFLVASDGIFNASYSYTDTGGRYATITLNATITNPTVPIDFTVQAVYNGGPIPLTNLGNPTGTPALIAGNSNPNTVTLLPATRMPWYATTAAGSLAWISQTHLDGNQLQVDGDGRYIEVFLAAKPEDNPGFRGIKTPEDWGKVKGMKVYNPFVEEWKWVQGTAALSIQDFVSTIVTETLGGVNYDYEELIDSDIESDYTAQTLRIYFND